MSAVQAGFAGALVGAGLFAWIRWLTHAGRLPLYDRILPSLRDLPTAPTRPTPAQTGGRALLVDFQRACATRLDGVLGGRESVQRRLDRLGSERTVEDFRMEQAAWGLGALVAGLAIALLYAYDQPQHGPALLICVLVAAFFTMSLRENALTSKVRRREAQIMLELPVVAELLALAVAAGEGPLAAIERVVQRSKGELARDLTGLLGRVRTGTPISQAFDDYARTTGVRPVERFSAAIAVALERGTPLADVLHAQAADVREAQRRDLIELGARREVLMMLPVVFLVLPVTVVFAFYPGVIGLELTAP